MLPTQILQNRTAQSPSYQINLVQVPLNNNHYTNQKIFQPQVLKHVDNYIIFNEKLGGGQFSSVYKAMDKNDKTKYFAAKIISLSPSQFSRFSNYNEALQKEIDILLKARHENLICMHDLKQTSNNLYLFLDYCNGGNLRQYLVKKQNRLSEEESIELFKQMCAGYKALNEKKIIHRDIKPENVMLNDNKIKIGDFGFARCVFDLEEANIMTQKCSPLYAPPQILLNKKYSSKCDVWSMGCMIFEMLFGKPPFTAHSVAGLTENILKTVGFGPYNLPSFPPLQPETKDILAKMLMYHEKDRISWDEIFRHPILQKQLQKKLIQNVVIEPSNPLLEQSIRKNIEAVWDPTSSDTKTNTQNQQPNSSNQIIKKNNSINDLKLPDPSTVTGIENYPSPPSPNYPSTLSPNYLSPQGPNYPVLSNENTVSSVKNKTKNIMGTVIPSQPSPIFNNQNHNISVDTLKSNLDNNKYHKNSQLNNPIFSNHNNNPSVDTLKSNLDNNRSYKNSSINNNIPSQLNKGDSFSNNFNNLTDQAEKRNYSPNNTKLDSTQEQCAEKQQDQNSPRDPYDPLKTKDISFKSSKNRNFQIPATAQMIISPSSSTISKNTVSSPQRQSTNIINSPSTMSTNANNLTYPKIRGISPCHRKSDVIESQKFSPKGLSTPLAMNQNKSISSTSFSSLQSPFSKTDRDNQVKKPFSQIDYSSYKKQQNIEIKSPHSSQLNRDYSPNSYSDQIYLKSPHSSEKLPNDNSTNKKNPLFVNGEDSGYKSTQTYLKQKDKAEDNSQFLKATAASVNGQQSNYKYSDTSINQNSTIDTRSCSNTTTENVINKYNSQSNYPLHSKSNSNYNNYSSMQSNFNSQNNNSLKSLNSHQASYQNNNFNQDSSKINIPNKIEKDLSEDDKYLLCLKQIKQKEEEKAFVTKIDNFFAFMRKRALFANATLLNFWNSTRLFHLPSHIQCQVLYCLCSYYLLGLQQLKLILTKEMEPTIVKEGAFKIYEKSIQYIQTREQIIEDVAEAKKLFDAIQPYMTNEISFSQSQEARSFSKFILSKPTSHEEFKVKLFKIFPKEFSTKELSDLDKTAAKGIYMTQVFTHIQEFIPSKKYLEFDFIKFYDDLFNNLSLEELKLEIISFNQRFNSLSKESGEKQKI